MSVFHSADSALVCTGCNANPAITVTDGDPIGDCSTLGGNAQPGRNAITHQHVFNVVLPPAYNAQSAQRGIQHISGLCENRGMAIPAHVQSLYEALEALPEGYSGEIIGGRLYTQPRPAAPHIMVGSVIGADLLNPYQRGRGGPGGWWILDEPEVHFVRNTELTVPNLAGWRRERMPTLPEDHRFEIVPDWICEILSPATGTHDREVKMPLYAHYGVRWLWMIDPKAHILQAYELRDGVWHMLNEFKRTELICVAPFSEVSLEPPWL